MPPRTRYTRENLLNAALELVRRDGMDALNARSLAHEMGCSTQPLFREFASMTEIREEVFKRAFEVYVGYINESMTWNMPKYKSTGMAYILFARREPELFKLIFMHVRPDGSRGNMDDDPTMNYVAETIMRATGFTREQALSFHLRSWIFAHGLATLLVTDYVEFTDEQISALLSDQFNALKLFYTRDMEARDNGDKLTTI